MSGKRIQLVTAICLAVFGLADAARGDLDSGPAVGEAVPKLKVTMVTGDQAGQEADVAEIRGDKPTIFLFVPAERFDRPTARFLKKLDEALGKEGKESAGVAVWLSETPEKSRDYLPRAQMSLQFMHTALGVFPSQTMPPDGWVIHDRAAVTAVVVRGKKVKARFGYGSVNETVVPEVVEALKKALAE
jgi:hypothetical protein